MGSYLGDDPAWRARMRRPVRHCGVVCDLAKLKFSLNEPPRGAIRAC